MKVVSHANRIELAQLQQKINQKLNTKERVDLYWTSLALYLEEKLSKKEWDMILQLQLGFDFGMCACKTKKKQNR